MPTPVRQRIAAIAQAITPMDKKIVPRTISITSPRRVSRAASAAFMPFMEHDLILRTVPRRKILTGANLLEQAFALRIPIGVIEIVRYQTGRMQLKGQDARTEIRNACTWLRRR